MKSLRSIVASAVLCIAATGPAAAADAFPNKPIRIVVSSAPGGLLDTTTRFVAQKLAERFGQQVVVENRVGAGGLLAIRGVKSAAPDGYTLLSTPGTILIQQHLNRDPGYDIEKDFVPLGATARAPLLLVTAADSVDKSLGDFMTRARSNPGKLTYASAGMGTTTHLGAAAFVQRAGLNLTHVPYKGNAAAWPDVIAGRIDMIFEPYGSGASMLQGGKMKALGVASLKRLDALPDLPTFAEQGLPDFTSATWFGLFAPAGTPKAVVQPFADALRAVMTSAEMKERLRADGSEAMLLSPDEFGQFVRRELGVVGKLVNDLALPKE